MKVRKSLLGLFLFVALVVSACGGAASTPEAAMEEMGAEAVMAKDSAAGTVEDDAGGTMETSDAEAMMEDDAVTMMKDDVGSTMETGDAEAMMEDDDEATTGQGDAEASMGKEGSAAMADMDDAADMMKAGNADAAMGQEGSETTMEEEGSKALQGEATMDLPAWFNAELTDVNTGEALTVADLKGKVVLVETMAIWCSNCLRQQQEVKALHEVLGERKDLVTLVLDVDPNEDAGNLKDYAARHGFTWAYAVAPREVAREIGQLYGNQFLNPPSTPMLIVDRHGEVHLLPFGRKTAADLQEALAPFLSEGM